MNDRISFEVPTQPAAVSLVRLSVTQVARGVDGTCFGSRLPIDELTVVFPTSYLLWNVAGSPTERMRPMKTSWSSLFQAPSILGLRHCRVCDPPVHYGGYRLVLLRGITCLRLRCTQQVRTWSSESSTCRADLGPRRHVPHQIGLSRHASFVARSGLLFFLWPPVQHTLPSLHQVTILTAVLVSSRQHAEDLLRWLGFG